jgi:hypothetical protein
MPLSFDAFTPLYIQLALAPPQLATPVLALALLAVSMLSVQTSQSQSAGGENSAMVEGKMHTVWNPRPQPLEHAENKEMDME